MITCFKKQTLKNSTLSLVCPVIFIWICTFDASNNLGLIRIQKGRHENFFDCILLNSNDINLISLVLGNIHAIRHKEKQTKN